MSLSLFNSKIIGVPHAFMTRDIFLNKDHGQGIIQYNLKKLGEYFSIDVDRIILMNQKHSNIVHFVDNTNENWLEGDALVTNIKGILLLVQTADCVPILVVSKIRSLVAVIHAGWKGSIKGIIENTIRMCFEHSDDLICALGPCIHQDFYEVGREVYDMVGNDLYFKKRGERFFFNLQSYASDKLKKLGVSQIDCINQDTYSQPDLFFSYRRSCHKGTKKLGNQVSCIML